MLLEGGRWWHTHWDWKTVWPWKMLKDLADLLASRVGHPAQVMFGMGSMQMAQVLLQERGGIDSAVCDENRVGLPKCAPQQI